MILPIVAYGHGTLRKECVEVTPQYPDLETLIANMWETMYNSNGVGIAAPQINHAIRLFMIDSVQIVEGAEDEEDIEKYKNEKPTKQLFINPKIVKLEGKPWKYEEGCLSIPKIREMIERDEIVTITFLDENFNEQTQTYDGLTARIILHEFDHIEGKLFIDYLPPLKKRLLKKKLDDISKGRVKVDYRMLLPK
jgi:peptide deformylase